MEKGLTEIFSCGVLRFSKITVVNIYKLFLFTRQKLTMTFSPDISPPVFQAISNPFDSQKILFRPFIAVAKEVPCILRASMVNVQCSKFTAPHDTTTTTTVIPFIASTGTATKATLATTLKPKESATAVCRIPFH